MNNTHERLYALIDMSKIVVPKVTVHTNVDGSTKPLKVCESIWTDVELKAIKKEMIECVKELKDNPNDN